MQTTFSTSSTTSRKANSTRAGVVGGVGGAGVEVVQAEAITGERQQCKSGGCGGTRRLTPCSSLCSRAPSTQPFKRDVWLQANYRFLASSTVDVGKLAGNPDLMLDWGEQLRPSDWPAMPSSSSSCSTFPAAPQATSCRWR